MRQASVYCVECLCGQHIETEAVELDCPACKRKLRIEWDAEVKAVVADAEQETVPAAA
jgi:Zn finger protein HypA/HybF involved in hydrogenase expression